MPNSFRWSGVLEGVLSAAAVLATLFLPVLAIGASFCAFGECATPTRDEVRLSQAIAAGLVLAVGATFVLAVRRGARWAWLWHLLVAMAAAASVLLFTLGIDWRELVREEPPPRNPDYVPCYSGSGECVGG